MTEISKKTIETTSSTKMNTFFYDQMSLNSDNFSMYTKDTQRVELTLIKKNILKMSFSGS